MIRNVTAYQMAPEVFDTARERLTIDKLAHLSRDLTDTEVSQIGFAPPEHWSWQDNYGLHFDVYLTERVLPAEVIALKLHAKCRAFEEESGAWPGAKRVRELKTELLSQLIPSAPQRRQLIPCYLAEVGGYRLILIGTAKAALAETVLKLIRRELGSFPVIPLAIDTDVKLFLTEAILDRSLMPSRLVQPQEGALPSDLTVLDRVTLVGPDKAKASFANMNLASEEVQECLRNGMKATKLTLQNGASSTFAIDTNLTLHGFQLLDIDEEVVNEETDRWGLDKAMRVIEAAELRTIFWRILLWLGVGAVASEKKAA